MLPERVICRTCVQQLFAMRCAHGVRVLSCVERNAGCSPRVCSLGYRSGVPSGGLGYLSLSAVLSAVQSQILEAIGIPPAPRDSGFQENAPRFGISEK